MFEFSMDKYRNKRAKKNKPRLDFSQRVRSIFEACLKCCLCYDVVLIFLTVLSIPELMKLFVCLLQRCYLRGAKQLKL